MSSSRESIRNSFLNSVNKNYEEVHTDKNDNKFIKISQDFSVNSKMTVSFKNKVSPNHAKSNSVYPLFISPNQTKDKETSEGGSVRKVSSVGNGINKELLVKGDAGEAKIREKEEYRHSSSHVRKVTSVENCITTDITHVSNKKPYVFGKGASAKFVTTDCVETSKPSNVPKLILPDSNDVKSTLK